MKPELEISLTRLARSSPDEAERVRPLLALLRETRHPFRREQFAPGHITASACVVDEAARHTLLVHHAKLERWLQPGGHLEDDDASVLAASRREVAEECGIDRFDLVAADPTPIDVDVHAIPRRGREPGHHHFDVRYAFVADPAEPLAVSEESLDVRWVPIESLQRYTDEESVLRLVRRAAARLTRARERSRAGPC